MKILRHAVNHLRSDYYVEAEEEAEEEDDDDPVCVACAPRTVSREKSRCVSRGRDYASSSGSDAGFDGFREPRSTCKADHNASSSGPWALAIQKVTRSLGIPIPGSFAARLQKLDGTLKTPFLAAFWNSGKFAAHPSGLTPSSSRPPFFGVDRDSDSDSDVDDGDVSSSSDDSTFGND